MTSEDETGLSEDEVDEIVGRVVEKLGGELDGADESADGGAARSPADGRSHADEDASRADDEQASQTDDEGIEVEVEAPGRGGDRGGRDEERSERHGDRSESPKERGHERLERLGERIEDRVERRVERLADHLERSLERSDLRVPEPPAPGRERAVYKTQLQKGGRIAVPDAEVEALDLEPGDTLQVTLYAVE